MFSETFLDKCRGLRQSISPVNLADPAILRANMLMMAATMKASEELLQCAAEHCPALDFGKELKAYYTEHLLEESGHFDWIMRDLGLKSLPRVDWFAAEIVGAVYYCIKHVHPAALLGYMAVMECFPIPLETVEQLEQIHGTYKLRCVRFHAEHDPEHAKELLAMIDKVPEDLQSLVIETAIHTLLLMQSAQKNWG